MKKILIISDRFFPSIGGIEEQVKLLGENFRKKGYKVDILTNKFEKKIKNEETIFGLQIFRFYNIFYYVLFLIKNRNYELIISRQYYKNSFILGLLKITKIVKSKTIICADSGGENDEINNIKYKLKFLNLYKLYFYIIGKNNFLNCLNKYNIKNLNQILKNKSTNKIINIYNGIEVINFKTKKYNKIKNILFLGRLEKEKGIFETIQAFKLIKNNNIILNIVGYGDNKIEYNIKEIIKKDKRIIFHGKIYGEEKNKILNFTDLLILPSYTEGQPVTITEMAIKNIPVITTDVGNNKEIYGDNLIYVKKQNINDLKNKIEWIINNIKNYKYNYSEALKKIDINNITNQFLNLK